MTTNKSVEEIEELIKYFRGRTGGWGMVLDKSISEIEKDLRKNLQELLTSHTNTVLQGVVEKLQKEYGEPSSKALVIVESHIGGVSQTPALEIVSSLLNDQIISNEEKI